MDHLKFGDSTCGYHRERTEVLPREEPTGPQYARNVKTDLTAGGAPGTSEDELVAWMLGDLREAEYELECWQHERAKARAAKANRRKA